jgi:hypothetical protein
MKLHLFCAIGVGLLATSALASNTPAVSPDVVVQFNQVNDGDVAASGYAYADGSSINTVSFIRSALLTVSNQQFMVYYGRHQTKASYPDNNTLWVARRTLGSNDWQVARTTFKADNIGDGHDVAVFGIDGAGFMHLSWGMHCGNLHYARSTAPVTGSGPLAFTPDLGAKGMTGKEVAVTYPQFIAQTNGDLLFLYRVGSSGGGDTWLNHWSVASQTWNNVNVRRGAGIPFIKGNWSGVDNYNAYPSMPCTDEAGNLYLIWCWRETPAFQSNHDLLFAQSPDGGVTWRRFDGRTYDLPISKSGEHGHPNAAAQIIRAIPQNYSLINQAGMCLDAANTPVAATWWAPATATNNYRRQYMVLFPNADGIWQVRQISQRINEPVGVRPSDSAVRELGRPVVICDRQNRLLVLYRDNTRNNGLKVACSQPFDRDPERRHWTTVVLTTDNLGSYEPVIDLARWQRDNMLDILYQASSGQGYAPPANTASPIGVLEWDATAYFSHHPEM